MRKIIASIFKPLIIRCRAKSILVSQIRQWDVYIDALRKSVANGDKK